jgi:hypothetical protein
MSPHHRAFPANLHLLVPTLHLPLAQSAVDEPAKVSHSKLPSRAILPEGKSAPPDNPAGADLSADPVLHRQKKKDLAFDVGRYFPPTLFETLHSPERSPQDLGHFLLSFLELLPNGEKFPRFHLTSCIAKSKGV